MSAQYFKASVFFALLLLANSTAIMAQGWKRINVQPHYASPRAFATNGNHFAWVGEYGGLGVSQDAGKSWSYSVAGSQHLNCLIILNDGELLVGGLQGTMMRSTDHGVNWIDLNAPSGTDILAFARQGETVVASTSSGTILRIANSSVEVVQVDGAPIHSLATSGDSTIAITASGKVYLSIAKADWQHIGSLGSSNSRQLIKHDGLWWSAGESWSLHSSPNLIEWTSHEIEEDAGQVPNTKLRLLSTPDKKLMALASEESQLIYEGYLKVGNIWSHEASFEPALTLRNTFISDGDSYSITSREIYRVEDPKTFSSVYETSGRSYAAVKMLESGVGYAVGVSADPTLPVLERNRSFIERTTDAGKSWRTVFTAQSDLKVRSLAVSHTGKLIVGADEGKVLRSDDGDEWVIETLQLAGSVKSVAFGIGDTAFVLVHPNVLSYSTDAGRTFATIPTQPSSSGIIDIEVLPNGHLYVLETKLVSKSIDGGSSWTTKPLDHPASAFHLKGDTVLTASSAAGKTTLRRSVWVEPGSATVHELSSPLQIFDIAHHGRHVAAVGHGTIAALSSSDGNEWSDARIANTSEYLSGVAGSPSSFIAVGSIGSMWKLDLGSARVQSKPQLSLVVRPNPSTSTISLPLSLNVESWSVSDLLGATVMRGSTLPESEVDVRLLHPGTYFLHVLSAGQLHLSKFYKVNE